MGLNKPDATPPDRPAGERRSQQAAEEVGRPRRQSLIAIVNAEESDEATCGTNTTIRAPQAAVGLIVTSQEKPARAEPSHVSQRTSRNPSVRGRRFGAMTE